MALDISPFRCSLPLTGCPAPEIVACVFAGLALITVTILLARWLLLPRPFSGIPHNKKAASQILGDVPGLKASNGVRAFMRDQFIKPNSPIVQVFMSPLSKPWVLIGDYREAHDIAASRFREFDKSKLTSDSFRGIVPQSFVSYKAEHPVYKHSKELLKDWMTPSFFRNVSTHHCSSIC